MSLVHFDAEAIAHAAVEFVEQVAECIGCGRSPIGSAQHLRLIQALAPEGSSVCDVERLNRIFLLPSDKDPDRHVERSETMGRLHRAISGAQATSEVRKALGQLSSRLVYFRSWGEVGFDPEENLNGLRQAAGALSAALRCRRREKPPAKRGLRKRISREEASQAMMEAVKANIERMKWSTHKWAEYVGCSSSTILKTQMWAQGTKARDGAKQERMRRQSGKRRPRHRSKA
jgi:hypothetical protein